MGAAMLICLNVKTILNENSFSGYTKRCFVEHEIKKTKSFVHSLE